jgi:hypothetical protein
LDLTFRYCTLAATKKCRANKQPCPCGSGRRLGRCHSRRVNSLRKRVGRTVLASEMRTIVLAVREQSRRKRIATVREEAARPKLRDGTNTASAVRSFGPIRLMPKATRSLLLRALAGSTTPSDARSACTTESIAHRSSTFRRR